MSTHEPDDDLSEERRKEIYLALMEAQELHDFTPAQARHLVAGRFQLPEARLRQIEDEGRDRLW
jgi:hypothetical protein